MFEIASKILPPSRSVRSLHPWIESQRFEAVPQKDVLDQILRLVEEAVRRRVRQGGKPVKVIFDLDSTLFDVKPRSLRILKEFAATPEAREFGSEYVNWCQGLQAHQLVYTIQESAAANGFPRGAKGEEFLKKAFQYWMGRFFTHSYVQVDHPVPGAADYVKAVVDRGAVAVYLTGRDWPGMGRGTQAMLRHWGFPLCTGEGELVMKPSFGTDDSEFKDAALRDLRIHGEAVALFDNEPANFHVFEKNFPAAHLVFFHSNCSGKEAKAVSKIYRIESFLR
ncbi:MAG: HAD family hydrolase [Bdellovibrionales bacterium]|nr:HAD family hydrolase [Bdellovibrionales bacterium]